MASPTSRQTCRYQQELISDLLAKVLGDAYGYSITLPSTLNSAYAAIDIQTGTLLVQGLPGAVDDTITIDTVSSNVDSADAVTLGNGIIDLEPVAFGNQISLRAAVREANAIGSGKIYVPKGNYALALTGTGDDDQGDLDITSDVTIIGAGPGSTVIDAGALGDRAFEVVAFGTNYRLELSRLTVLSGYAPSILMGGRCRQGRHRRRTGDF